MPFSEYFEEGEIDRNEDGIFVAQITAIDDDPVRWVEVAISDYVTDPINQGFIMKCNWHATHMEETTKRDSEGRRILRIWGPYPSFVLKTANGLCKFLRGRLLYLREDLTELDIEMLRTSCEIEADRNEEKAQQLFEEEYAEWEELRKRYFAEMEKVKIKRDRRKRQRKMKRERIRSEKSSLSAGSSKS